MSRPMIAARIVRNMPGRAKPYSIAAMLMRTVETLTPVMAAIAGVATGSAWRSRTRLGGRPLARAVRTKSSWSDS